MLIKDDTDEIKFIDITAIYSNGGLGSRGNKPKKAEKLLLVGCNETSVQK